MIEARPMKSKAPSLPEWAHGLTVEAVENGLLLKPRREPRVGWGKGFGRAPSTGHDELASTRVMTTEFDEKEWKW